MKIQHFLSKIKEYKRRATTNRNAEKNRSDVERWEEKESLFEDWNERTKIMAEYIPEGTKVLEFGAAKLVLKQFLPSDVIYTPSDLVDRGEGTIVCDINSKEYPVIQHQDVIFFSGVLEYIFDVPHLIAFLSDKTDKFIVSYCTFDYFSNIKNRKINGWVNAYTDEDFKQIFENYNFKLTTSKTWRHQTIYVFKKMN